MDQGYSTFGAGGDASASVWRGQPRGPDGRRYLPVPLQRGLSAPEYYPVQADAHQHHPRPTVFPQLRRWPQEMKFLGSEINKVHQQRQPPPAPPQDDENAGEENREEEELKEEEEELKEEEEELKEEEEELKEEEEELKEEEEELKEEEEELEEEEEELEEEEEELEEEELEEEEHRFRHCQKKSGE
ncbi:putative golgin subfamily A member 6-like protein 19 [Schistocerca americana]|uniref:putative golgin subfamily A member 6-like protein 19 n=1 Tax=Schistocerca americana TaxID=7009 RepID=UPI001F50332C|nr:putative golgin subfamily A member 6-like protein 19 [Schistocerca americana]